MQDKSNLFEFSGGKHLEVLIKPAVIKSDDSLKTLTPAERSCYFQEERKLQFFKIYTKRNCEIECFSNYSRETCGCVPFDVVRDPDTRVCGVTRADLDCNYEVSMLFKDYRSTGKLASCLCLTPCDWVTYSLEIRESTMRQVEWVGMKSVFGVQWYDYRISQGLTT